MKHLKVEDVLYVTRPLTLYEQNLWNILIGQVGRDPLPENHPQFYQLWAQFLWSRQDERLPMNLFMDILVPDFNDHQQECLSQCTADWVARSLLEEKWNVFTPGVEPPDYVLKQTLEEWKRRNGE
jgi:hypothetical protein